MKFTSNAPTKAGLYAWRTPENQRGIKLMVILKTYGGDIFNSETLESLPSNAEWCRLVPEDETQIAINALRELRNAISDFRGHGMPGFTDRALAYLVLNQADQVLGTAGAKG